MTMSNRILCILLSFISVLPSSAEFFLQDTSWCIQKTVIPYSYQTEKGRCYVAAEIQGNEMPAYVFLNYGILVVTSCSRVGDYYENEEWFDTGEWKLRHDTLEIKSGKPNPKVERFIVKRSAENENKMRLYYVDNMDAYDELARMK